MTKAHPFIDGDRVRKAMRARHPTRFCRLCSGEKLEALRSTELEGQIYIIDKRVKIPPDAGH